VVFTSIVPCYIIESLIRSLCSWVIKSRREHAVVVITIHKEPSLTRWVKSTTALGIRVHLMEPVLVYPHHGSTGTCLQHLSSLRDTAHILLSSFLTTVVDMGWTLRGSSFFLFFIDLHFRGSCIFRSLALRIHVDRILLHIKILHVWIKHRINIVFLLRWWWLFINSFCERFTLFFYFFWDRFC
jgi:hypothetical protein